MTKIFINEVDVFSGNAQKSSDCFAAGLDNIIKAFNMSLRWHTHVEVNGGMLNCYVEVHGKDEEAAVRMIERLFLHTVTTNDMDYGMTETRN